MLHYWFKAIVLPAILLTHVICGLLARLFVRERFSFVKLATKYVSRHGRWASKVFGLSIQYIGQENFRKNTTYFIVANHVSYLDVLPLTSFSPMAFVTSVEMREDRALGPITEVGGCLYVERRSREKLSEEIKEIEQALLNSIHVVVFPEATSTDGSQLRPFKRPLFAAAISAGVPILPVVIQYKKIDSQAVTSANRDLVCWYGKMPFASHFFGLMKLNKIEITVEFLPEIESVLDRDILVSKAEESVKSTYQPIQGAV